MATTQLLVLVFALALVAVSAVPVTLVTKTEIINKPAGPGCKLYNTSATCVDDKCCNWCGPANPTSDAPACICLRSAVSSISERPAAEQREPPAAPRLSRMQRACS